MPIWICMGSPASLGTRTNMGYLLGIGKRMINVSWGWWCWSPPALFTKSTSSRFRWTDVETLKVHVQVGELWGGCSPAVCSLPPPLDLERETTVVPHLSRFIPPPLSSLFLSPRHLPLLPLLRPSLLRFWRCAPPAHASTRPPKPLYVFFSFRIPSEQKWMDVESAEVFFLCL